MTIIDQKISTEEAEVIMEVALGDPKKTGLRFSWSIIHMLQKTKEFLPIHLSCKPKKLS
jgi:hypothetical protein